MWRLGGLEQEFDLGFRFEEKESGRFLVDPKTGTKIWAEPYLAFYVSVVRFDTPTTQRRTLHSGLTRSKWDATLLP
jgi:hypothetical protein